MAKYQYVNGVYTQDIPTVAEYVYKIVPMGQFLNASDADKGESHKDDTFVVTGKSEKVEDTIEFWGINSSGNTYTSIYGTDGTSTGSKFSYDTNLTKEQVDSAKFYESKLYYNTDSKKIVAIEVQDSQSVYSISNATYSDSSTDNKDDGKISIDGKVFQINTESLNTKNTQYTVTKSDGSTKKVALEAYIDATKSGAIYNLYDWNGDRDIDWVDISEVNYGYVTSYTEGKKIAFVLDGRDGSRLENYDGQNHLNASIDLTDSDENYEWIIADDVKEGSIVEIEISRAYSTDVKDCFATYTVTPVTEVADVQFTAVKNSDTDNDRDGSDGDYYFDGTKYKASSYMIANTTDEDEESELWSNQQKKLGDNFNLYLDRNGFIIYVQAVNGSFDDYLLIMKTDGSGYANMDTAKAYALLDTNVYKTLTVSEDVGTVEDDDENDVGFYNEKTGFDTTTDSYAVGALVGYKLDSSGKIDDMTYIGTYNKAKKQKGTDSHAIEPTQVEKFDDDTFKLTLTDKKSYLLTNDTKVFLYTDAGLNGSSSDQRDATKAVTASELAEIKSSSEYVVYATGVTLSGSTNASTLEAVALYCDDGGTGGNYFEQSAGDKYPALISSITQSVVSGSDSKYDFEISAWINGEKQSLKTEQKTNTQFNDEILKGFSSAKEAKNHFAWITLNGAGVVTKIEGVSESGALASNDDASKGDVWTSTRAVIVSKNNKGLTYIPFTNDSTTGWEIANNQVKVITDKVAVSNYAAYDSEVAFYTIDVRPAYQNIKSSVKDGPDGDYNVSSATAADVLVSSIAGETSDVYYMADLFFNNDGDIMAVYVYDKDLSVNATAFEADSKVATAQKAADKAAAAATEAAAAAKDADDAADAALKDIPADYDTLVSNEAQFKSDYETAVSDYNTVAGNTSSTLQDLNDAQDKVDKAQADYDEAKEALDAANEKQLASAKASTDAVIANFEADLADLAADVADAAVLVAQGKDADAKTAYLAAVAAYTQAITDLGTAKTTAADNEYIKKDADTVKSYNDAFDALISAANTALDDAQAKADAIK
jgi:hypothetical protein